jgi:hypothetical protein
VNFFNSKDIFPVILICFVPLLFRKRGVDGIVRKQRIHRSRRRRSSRTRGAETRADRKRKGGIARSPARNGDDGDTDGWCGVFTRDAAPSAPVDQASGAASTASALWPLPDAPLHAALAPSDGDDAGVVVVVAPANQRFWWGTRRRRSKQPENPGFVQDQEVY